MNAVLSLFFHLANQILNTTLVLLIQVLCKQNKSLLCLIYCFISQRMSDVLLQLAAVNDTAR